MTKIFIGFLAWQSIAGPIMKASKLLPPVGKLSRIYQTSKQGPAILSLFLLVCEALYKLAEKNNKTTLTTFAFSSTIIYITLRSQIAAKGASPLQRRHLFFPSMSYLSPMVSPRPSSSRSCSIFASQLRRHLFFPLYVIFIIYPIWSHLGRAAAEAARFQLLHSSRQYTTAYLQLHIEIILQNNLS